MFVRCVNTCWYFLFVNISPLHEKISSFFNGGHMPSCTTSLRRMPAVQRKMPGCMIFIIFMISYEFLLVQISHFWLFFLCQLTNEWVDGVLARIMRDICAEETPDQKWVMFDGPVDTLWIESMNTLLDDNKILTLLNGERINMPSQVPYVNSLPCAFLWRISIVFVKLYLELKTCKNSPSFNFWRSSPRRTWASFRCFKTIVSLVIRLFWNKDLG